MGAADLSCDFTKMMANKNSAVKKLTGGLGEVKTPRIGAETGDFRPISRGIEGLFKRDKVP